MMDKIAIIGSPGAGKTTLAKDLGFILKMEAYHLERLFWQRGWKAKTRDKRKKILQKLVKKKQWIIEGTYLSSSEPRLEAADTIIFLDISSFLCLRRITKRYLESCFLRTMKKWYEYQGRFRKIHFRHDIPDGCTDKLTPYRMLKVLVFPFRGRKKITQKLHVYSSKRIIQLHSLEEVEKFLASPDSYSSEAPRDKKIVLLKKVWIHYYTYLHLETWLNLKKIFI